MDTEIKKENHAPSSGRLSHWTGVIILALWGSVLLYFYASGRVTHYLTSDSFFRTGTLVAGVVLFVLAVFNACLAPTAHSGGSCEDDGHAHGDDDGGHNHDTTFDGGWTAAVVLIVPLLLAGILTPDAFSANAVRNKMALAAGAVMAKSGQEIFGEEKGKASKTTDSKYGSLTREDLDRMVKKNAKGDYLVSIAELFYTAGDIEIQNLLVDQPVETSGQVLPERMNNADGRRIRMFVLYVECCAADSRPLSILVEFSERAPEIKEMGWYKIAGKMSYRTERGVVVPVLEAKSIEEAAEKKQRIIY